MTCPDDLIPSSTSIIDHPISEIRLQNLHHFLTETSKVTITLAETQTFVQVMREDVLALRLRIQQSRSGHCLQDDEVWGPMLEERVRAAFPGNAQICRKINWRHIENCILTWRTMEKVELGETFSEDDLGQVLFNHAAYGSVSGMQSPCPYR